MAESKNVLLRGASKNSQSPSAANEPRSVFSVGEAEVKEDEPLYRRHKCACISVGICVGFIVLLGIVILILALAVFKAKQPVIQIDDIFLDNLNITGNITNLGAAAVNLTLGVAVSVYNPNHASFKYTNSTSYMFYHGIQVGEAPIPAGRIGARGTERLTTTLKLIASQVLKNPNVVSDYLLGSFPITTTAEVSGRINILNIFKRHATSYSDCSMSISISDHSVQNMTCANRVKY